MTKFKALEEERLGPLLLRLRTQRKLKRAELAVAIGISSSTVIGNWEIGNYNPSASNLKKLSEYYSIPHDEFIAALRRSKRDRFISQPIDLVDHGTIPGFKKHKKNRGGEWNWPACERCEFAYYTDYSKSEEMHRHAINTIRIFLIAGMREGKFPPGKQLSLIDIGTYFKMSRKFLRETMEILAKENLIIQDPENHHWHIAPKKTTTPPAPAPTGWSTICNKCGDKIIQDMTPEEEEEYLLRLTPKGRRLLRNRPHQSPVIQHSCSVQTFTPGVPGNSLH